MFFFLSKALLFLLSPFFWLLVGVFLFFRTKNARWRKRLKIILPLYFLFFTNTAILLEFKRLWEVPGTKITQLVQHDIAIIPGGMFEYDSQMERLSIRRGGDRLVQAFTLFKKEKIKRFLLTGDNGYVSERGLHEAEQVRDLLLDWGVPDSLILVESKSKNTHENAAFTAKLLKKKGIQPKALLITSGLHMKRAKACFEAEGIKVTPFSTDLFTGKRRGYQWDQILIPNIQNFVLWNEFNKEWIGYVVYWVKGFV